MDKVQKIREEVVRLKSQLLNGACSSQIAMETRCKEEAYNEVLAILDIMQEEPKKCMYAQPNYTDKDRNVLCNGCEEECKYAQKEEPIKIKKGCKYRSICNVTNNDTGNISFVAGKIYLAPEDDTLVSEENEWLCDTSENSSNFELVEEYVSSSIEAELDNYIKDNFTIIEEGNLYAMDKDDMLAMIKHFLSKEEHVRRTDV